MGTKERLRLTVRWMCFALLLTATALRLCAEVGIQGFRQTWERFRKSDETPTVLTSEAPTDATFPTMLYIPPAAGPALTSEDAALVTVINRTGVSFDAEELMCRPLPLTCTSDEPLILIVHTHASEAYSGGDYVESGAFHTTDTDNNVVAVGQALADTLNACGIKTLHDMTLNDVPDYSGAYERTEEVILRYLEEYPSIQMVIDVHRDAVTDADGAELAMTGSRRRSFCSSWGRTRAVCRIRTGRGILPLRCSCRRIARKARRICFGSCPCAARAITSI